MDGAKITHVVENLARGGLERVVIDLAIWQQAHGADCSVVCLFEEGQLAGELRDRGIPVVACGKHGGLDLHAMRRLRRAIAARRTTTLHTHNDMAHYYTVAAMQGIARGTVVNTRHSMGSRTPSSRQRMLYGAAMRWTDYAVAVCDAARDNLASAGVRPRHALLSIPNGIHADGSFARSDASRRDFNAEFGLAEGTRVIGTVGRLNAVKDHANLIRAFREVHAAMPATALVLVGEGGLHAELAALSLEQGVADAVHFLGDRGDVRRLLAGFDLFVMSSRSEGYSIALLEACAAALPIVATDVGGNREIVRDGVNGRLVQAGDAGALARAIGAMLSLPRAEVDGLGRRGREWVVTEGSFDHMAQRYARLYATGSGA